MDNINPARAAKGVASTSEQLQKGTDLYAQVFLDILFAITNNTINDAEHVDYSLKS